MVHHPTKLCQKRDLTCRVQFVLVTTSMLDPVLFPFCTASASHRSCVTAEQARSAGYCRGFQSEGRGLIASGRASETGESVRFPHPSHRRRGERTATRIAQLGSTSLSGCAGWPRFSERRDTCALKSWPSCMLFISDASNRSATNRSTRRKEAPMLPSRNLSPSSKGKGRGGGVVVAGSAGLLGEIRPSRERNRFGTTAPRWHFAWKRASRRTEFIPLRTGFQPDAPSAIAGDCLFRPERR